MKDKDYEKFLELSIEYDQIECPRCSGYGVNPEDPDGACWLCEHDGSVTLQSAREWTGDSLWGEFDDVICPKCEGEGCVPKDSDNECSLCEGGGYVMLETARDWIDERLKKARLKRK